MKKYCKLIAVILSVMMITTLFSGYALAAGPENADPSDLTTEEMVSYITQSSDDPDAVPFTWASTETSFDANATLKSVAYMLYELKSLLGDKIEIKCVFGGVYGSSADDVIGGLQSDTFQASTFSSASLSGYTSAFLPFDMAYLFTSAENAEENLNGKVGEVVAQKCLDDCNIRVLSWNFMGFRHMTTKDKEVHTPEDLKGLKIRTQDNTLHMAAFNAFGASPSVIPWGDLYLALQQNVVDGQENPLINIRTGKFEEVQKYLILTNHLYSMCVTFVDDTWFQAQSPEVQDALNKAGLVGTEKSFELVAADEQSVLDYLGEYMTIIELTDEEIQKFADIAYSVYDSMAETIGEDYYNTILDAAGIVVE